MRRLWPKGTPAETVPPDAEGVTWEEWEAAVRWKNIDDPIRRRDLERARAEQEKKLAAKRGKR